MNSLDTDLSGATLLGATLLGVDLSDADLKSADLSGARLSGADLSGARFAPSSVKVINLRGANREILLSGANLSGADLRGAQGLTQKQLDDICGIDVKLDPGLTIKPCK